MSDDRRASAKARYVLRILQKFNSVKKLVAQTYDGASVMSSELNGVQAKIKEDMSEAGLRTRTRKNSIFLRNSNLNSKLKILWDSNSNIFKANSS